MKKRDEKDQPLYAVRKPVYALTRKEVDRIADETIHEIIINHLKRSGVDISQDNEKSKVWKSALEKPVFLSNKNGAPVPIKRVRIHKPSTAMIHLVYRAVEPGNNHHVEIYRHTQGRKAGQWEGDVISTFEVARRVKDGEPLIQRKKEYGREFVMSLSINEMIQVGENGDVQYWRVQKMDQSGTIIFRPNYYGGKVSDTDNPPIIMRCGAKTMGEKMAGKVTIDPLGRVASAND